MRAFALLLSLLSVGFLGCVQPASNEASRAGPDDAAPATESAPDLGRIDLPSVDALPPGEMGLTYEIYVRSFQDTDGDGIGDLDGVRSRLDHLESMGVRTLWLMPVFPSFGPAGYDVTDFDRVRPDYGDTDALVALVDDAHARGMRVLLDLPINHVARTHPWFVEADDAPGPARDQFLFADTQWDTYRWFPAEGGGYYYAFFGPDLPDLDWTNAEVNDRMKAVFAQWLEVADGYRLDAVIMLVEADGAITGTAQTHALLADLHALARATNPSALLLGEASEDGVAANVAYLGSANAPESDRVLDFPRRAALLASIAAGDPEPLLAVLREQRDAGALGRTAPFVSSHDVARLPEVVPNAAARRLLQVLQLTLPGDPVLYYGEELDLPDATSGTGQDYAQRAPMPWDGSPNAGFTTGVPWFTLDPGYATGANVAAAEADPASLLTLVRDLACVRDAIDGADWEPLVTDRPSVLAYARTTEDGRVIVVANLAGTDVGEVRVDVRGGLRQLTGSSRGVHALPGLVLRGLGPHGYALYSDEIAGRCIVAGPV